MTAADTERLFIWLKGPLGWASAFRFDALPRMRAVDLLGLVSGLAIVGNLVQYEGRFYEVQGPSKLRPMTKSQVAELGLGSW